MQQFTISDRSTVHTCNWVSVAAAEKMEAFDSRKFLITLYIVGWAIICDTLSIQDIWLSPGDSLSFAKSFDLLVKTSLIDMKAIV